MPVLIALTLLAAGALQPPSRAAPRRPFAELKPSATIRIGAAADWVQITHGSVWVGARNPDAVRRIDPRTNTITATVRLPGPACSGMTPAFGALWVPVCGRGGGLARISLGDATLSAFYPVGAPVREGGVAASSDSLWMPQDDQGHVLRLDPRTGRIRQVLDLCPGAENPLFFRRTVWVTCSSGAGVARIAAEDGRILGRVATGPRPRFLAAGRTAVWTLNQGDGSVTRIDADTGRTTATIALGTPGHGGDIQVGGGRVWTTLAGTPLSMINPKTNALERQWVGAGGDSLNYGFGSVWLTNYDRGLLQRFPRARLISRGPKR